MKLFEVTVTRDRLSVRREAEQRLTAEQKTSIILTAIICGTFLGFISLLAV